MTAADLIIDPTEKQEDALDDFENPQFNRYLHDGGARSGKTFITALWLISECAKYPNAKILLCRKNYNHAVSTVWNETVLPIVRGKEGFSYQLSPTITVNHKDGGQMVVAGLDSKDRIDKILGDEYTHIFINEATQCEWPMVQTLLTRLARNAHDADGNSVKRQLILDCNPKSARHWLHRIGVERIDPDTLEALPDADKWCRRHWTPVDNPHLAEDYMQTLRNLPEISRKRMYSGVWCDNEGVVYEEFDEGLHCFDDLPEGADQWTRVAGIDFGYNNPFVYLACAVDKDGAIWVYDEHYKSKLIVAEHCDIIKSRFDPARWIVADHDAEDRATMRKEGIATIAAKKDILQGIEAVKQRFMVGGNGKPRLYISRKCRNTLNELYAYSWPESKEGKSDKEVPIDLDNHALDALRYIVAEFDLRARSRVIGL